MTRKERKQNTIIAIGILLFGIFIGIGARAGFLDTFFSEHYSGLKEDEYYPIYDDYESYYCDNDNSCTSWYNGSEVVDINEKYSHTELVKNEIKNPVRTEKAERIRQQLTAANGITIQFIEKDEFMYWNDPKATSSEQIIRVQYLDGTSKDIRHITPEHLPISINRVWLSPLGSYLHIDVRYYEGSEDQIYNIITGETVLPEGGLNINWTDDGIQRAPVIWAPDESFAVFITYFSEYDGGGEFAVNMLIPEKHNAIEPIFTFGGYITFLDKKIDYPNIESVSGLRANENIVSFFGKDKQGKLTEYTYNVSTKEITSFKLE